MRPSSMDASSAPTSGRGVPSSIAAQAKANATDEADVTGVENRRMHGEREILQQRVQIVAVCRRRQQAQEGIRRCEREQQEAGADEAQHAEHAREESLRQAAAERSRPPASRSTAPGSTAAASLRARPRPRRRGRTSAAPSSSSAPRSAPRSRARRTMRPGSRRQSATNTNWPATAGRATAIQSARRAHRAGEAEERLRAAPAAARGSARNGRVPESCRLSRGRRRRRLP